MNDKFTWQSGDIVINPPAMPQSTAKTIARLRAIILTYEARAFPSLEETVQYQEAKRKLASLLSQRKD